MKNTINSKNLLLVLLIFISLASYLFGYITSENSAGGGEVDFGFVWRNLQTFNNHSLFEAIKLTAIPNDEIFQSTRTPGFYILNKLFNPFISNIKQFQLSIFCVSAIIPIVFFFSLKKKFQEEKKIYLFLISSILFLSPYFRTSAIWGLEENLGIFSAVLSGYFFIAYNEKKYFINKKISLLFLAIASSLCVYFDQKLIIIPLICYFSIISKKENNKLKLILTLYYFIFSLPFLYLISIWGNIVPASDAAGRGILNNFNFYHLGYVLTILGFYFFPLLLFIKNIKKKINEVFNKKNILIFLSLLIFIIYFLIFHNLNNEYYLGGGAIKKLIQLIFNNIYFQKFTLVISFILSLLVIMFIKNNNNINNFVLFFLIFTSILITPALFQEYYDPLIFILFFLFFKNNLIINFKNCFILFSYFLIFLVSANFYY